LISDGKTPLQSSRLFPFSAAAANHTLMRKTLFAAAALAPLWFLAQTEVRAQTTINNSTSTPVTTAADGDITINAGGSITPTGAGTAAVTVNSSNNVTNGGTLSYKDVNSATGILIIGGNTVASGATPPAIGNSGTIALTETYAASDTNKDGVNEAPFASPTSDARYGIRLAPNTGTFIGSIVNSGAINVQGDNSYAISLESPLQGTVSTSGTIQYVGNGGAGLQETAGVSGSIAINGTITATGSANSQTTPLLGANAVVLSGPVGGSLSLYSALTSTGYGLTTRPTSPTSLNTIQGTPSEIQQGGSAVAGGIFLAAPPATTNSTDVTTDADGDGVIDSAETTGTITTSGSAPALVISGMAANGAAGGPITIGGYSTVTSDNPNNGASLILEGTVQGAGVYDGQTATALQIGGLGAATTFTGGLRITGTVEADSYGASATAIHIGALASIPSITNTGSIDASILSPNSTTDTIPPYGSTANPATAIDVQIDANANVGALNNTGIIAASITGNANDVIAATALIDRSGSLSSVFNSGQITASFTPDSSATGLTILGTAGTRADGSAASSGSVALDLSANTSGVTLTQQQGLVQQVTTTVVNNVATVSTTYLQPTTLQTQTITNASTVTTTTPSSGVTVVTTVPESPAIVGDIYLGSGSNTVNLQAGSISGALDLGSGPTSSFTITNGAIYDGALTYTGGALALDVESGTLSNLSASASRVGAAAYNLSSLTVGSTGQVLFGVDPAYNNGAGRNAEFIVNGTATFAAGAKIGLNFISNAVAPETITLVKANTLNVAESATALAGSIPYLFDATFATDPAAGTITASIVPKTTSELGLNPSQAAALPAVSQALTKDAPLQAQLLGQFTRQGFFGVYNQLLPDYAGGTFQAANAASQAISRATAESNNIENPTGSRGAWVQEIFVGVNQGEGKTDGFRGGGFGFVGGVETGGSGLGAFGLTTAFVSTGESDPHLPGDNNTSLSELELGGYWQGEFSGLTADARIGGGYTWMAGRREYVETDTAGDITLDRKVKSNWNGYTLSGRFGLAYKVDAGSHFLGGGWFVQPQAHIDYFRLDENKYSDNEAQGGPGFALTYNSRTGQETSGTASFVVGRAIGTGLVWRPQVELGVRDVFSGDAGDTTARYISGGPSFTLTPADITGLAGVARLKVKASSEYYEIGVEAGGEVLSSRYEEGDMRVTARVLF
jgi:hypothetical protein